MKNSLTSFLKKSLQNSIILSLLRYLRYFIYRYVINRFYFTVQLSKKIHLQPVDDGICFFGYYNISPVNGKGDILYLKVNQEKVRGSLFEPASIMLKKANGSITKIAETKSWNWQQGCMLHWYPNRDDQIIFNDYDNENDFYISIVINTSGEINRKYEMPIYDISKCGKYALTLNYDRLAIMRPDYGYFNRRNAALPNENEDGIWRIDLDAGKINLIIALEQLKKLSYSPTMEGAMHKVNHIDINPTGTRFMFLHRWVGPKGRFMRLITADSDGSDLYILNGDRMISHCCWLNDDEILSFCDVNDKRGYFKFTDISNNVSLMSEKLPIVDGHPSISPDGMWIIMDSYPDKSRFSSLFLYNIKNDKILELGKFHQPLRYNNEMRIDLHPKWGFSSSKIIIESGHEGNRRLYLIEFM